MFVRQAVFLVGGKGTRLGPISAATAKPLLEIAPGLRFLDVLLDQAARHGFDDIILLAGHLGEQVEAIYQGRMVRQARIEVIREPEPAGTAGALMHAAARLDQQFLLANGDALFDFNLRALATQLDTPCLGRLSLRVVPDASRYGSVELHGDRIVRFREKVGQSAAPGLINGGVYLLDRAILDHVRLPSSLEMDVFPKLAEQGLLTGKQFDGYFLDIGLPESYARAVEEVSNRLRRPAAFLDRDGVLNIDGGYTFQPADLQWVHGAREAVLNLNEAGYYVFVVSNQAGVARGLYTEADVTRFHDWMQQQLAEVGAHIDAFYYCPYHADASVEIYRHADHPDRKPNHGMIARAMREWPIAREKSFLIGDRDSDVEAARRASIHGHLFDGSDLGGLVQRLLADGPRAASN